MSSFYHHSMTCSEHSEGFAPHWIRQRKFREQLAAPHLSTVPRTVGASQCCPVVHAFQSSQLAQSNVGERSCEFSASAVGNQPEQKTKTTQDPEEQRLYNRKEVVKSRVDFKERQFKSSLARQPLQRLSQEPA
eukprot:5928075-Amphidinium_carterae.1